jgi:hypothetical protein
VRLLRLWLTLSAIGLAALAVWAFAPVLVFVFLLLAALAVLSLAMILLARVLRLLRERGGRGALPPGSPEQ